MIFAAGRMATATSVFSESALKWFTFSKVGYYRGKIKDALVNSLARLWVGQRRQTQPLLQDAQVISCQMIAIPADLP